MIADRALRPRSTDRERRRKHVGCDDKGVQRSGQLVLLSRGKPGWTPFSYRNGRFPAQQPNPHQASRRARSRLARRQRLPAPEATPSTSSSSGSALSDGAVRPRKRCLTSARQELLDALTAIVTRRWRWAWASIGRCWSLCGCGLAIATGPPAVRVPIVVAPPPAGASARGRSELGRRESTPRCGSSSAPLWRGAGVGL